MHRKEMYAMSASVKKKKVLQKAFAFVCALIVIASTTFFPFAVSSTASEIDTSEGVRLLSQAIDTFFDIVMCVGILLLAWGIIQLVLSIRSEDADSKVKATMIIVTAIILICINFIFGPVFEVLGYSP